MDLLKGMKKDLKNASKHVEQQASLLDQRYRADDQAGGKNGRVGDRANGEMKEQNLPDDRVLLRLAYTGLVQCNSGTWPATDGLG